MNPIVVVLDKAVSLLWQASSAGIMPERWALHVTESDALLEVYVPEHRWKRYREAWKLRRPEENTLEGTRSEVYRIEELLTVALIDEENQ